MRRPLPWICLALASATLFSDLGVEPTQAQESAGGDPSTSLARYVPKENLVLYVEFDGLDAHAEAWRKTAAYKILNTTTTGLMLEDVFTQLVGKIPGLKVSPTEILAMFKHVAKSGFVLAMGGDIKKPKPDYVVVVFRGAFKNKEVTPSFARMLQGLNGPTSKPQAVVRVGHKVISGTMVGGEVYSWWVEDSKKEDLILTNPSLESADAILETLDGKRPNAIDHPLRAGLTSPEPGFLPIGLITFDPAQLRVSPQMQTYGLSDIQRIDARGGFQDDAIMTVVRVNSPSPRKGFLTLLDGPTFDKASLPPLPESLNAFTAFSIDMKGTLDKALALTNQTSPDSGQAIKQAIESFQAKAKVRLREDVLAHLGPKGAVYVLPAKAGAAAPAAPAAPGMMGMMMAGMGLDKIPKLAIVLEVDDPAAFGKALDELMGVANRELKASMGRPPGGAPPGDAPGRGGNRNRAAAGPTLEFRLMTGENKTYVLSVPPEMASLIPATLRPTIRVGPKYLAIAVSPEVARLALEAKGSWTPPTELAGAFMGLSKQLKFLNVEDPRDSTPAFLAAFPAKLQTMINTAIMQNAPPPPPGAAGPAPGAPPSSGPPRGKFVTPGGAPGPMPGGPGGPGAPAPPGVPPSGPALLILQVDAAKLPSADAIRALLFPSVNTVEVTDEGFRFVTRQSFPILSETGQGPVFSKLMESIPRPGGPPPMGTPPGLTPGPAAGPANNVSPPGPGPGRPGRPDAPGRPGGGLRPD